MGQLTAVMPARSETSAVAIRGGLVAIAVWLFGMSWLAGTALAGDEPATRPAPTTIRGRVLDDEGRPMAGARVRLYRRDGRWQRQNPVVEETTAGLDGGFRLVTPLTPRPIAEHLGSPHYVLVADLPGKAVGWRTLPVKARSFEGDLTLRPPTSRTISVVDQDGRPVRGAKVVAYGLGDPASPLPDFRDVLELRPEDGPLTALTGADGRATLAQLPMAASYVATKSGFGESYAFNEQAPIRLTPAADLSGRLTGPGGEPLVGVKVVLYTVFMWDFERAVTDADGRYRFQDLRARGWDMGAWSPGKVADGQYKIWLDDDRFAMTTGSLTLEPGTSQVRDIEAVKAGVLRVTVLERGTEKPVAGVRVWGFDVETGSSARFNAYTDEQGRATFHAPPSRISLGIEGPPDGVYFEADLTNDFEANKTVEFGGGEDDVTLIMPRITGTLIDVAGICTLPDGSAARDATVNAGARGNRLRSGSQNNWNRRADAAGRFTLERVPSKRTLSLYTETADLKFAGSASYETPETGDPASRMTVSLRPTVSVEGVMADDARKPLGSRKFRYSPSMAEEAFAFLGRTVDSDAEGRVKFVGIVPGLRYRVEEVEPPQKGPIVMPVAGGLAPYDAVLAPEVMP